MAWLVATGDSRQVLAGEQPDAYDSCVCDPPYEFGFMGKSWDSTGIAFDPEFWKKVLACLKPGAHLLAFSGARTSHRMACAIEDAGFEIRDCLMWLYGTGFPKSLNLEGGRGTALKPAYEPVIMARKPLDATVEECAARWGTGALNIDACRIGNAKVGWGGGGGRGAGVWDSKACGMKAGEARTVEGRWPANVVLDEEAAALLDAQTGMLQSGKADKLVRHSNKFANTYSEFKGQEVEGATYGDSGGASRFFYTSKVSTKEREFGCAALPEVRRTDGRKTEAAHAKLRTTSRRNHHPTLKPVNLMMWLVRLVTPPGGVVLDPFAGAGSCGIAAVLEGKSYVGIEQSEEYAEIARVRIAAWESRKEAA